MNLDHAHSPQPAQRLHQDSAPPFWRSPQYVAFVLILLGFLLQWPTLLTLLTLLTLVMFPILLIMYARLAITEEAEMRKRFGADFETYAARTPRCLPSGRIDTKRAAQ